MNWAPVTFTPTSGSAVTFTGVTSVTADNGGNLIAFSGDGDRYMTTVVCDMIDPTFSVACADIAALNSLVPGTRGIFVATLLDAKNRATAGGGGMTYTASNAVIGDNSTGGQHRQFASGSLTIKTESPDGQTASVSVTAL